MLKHLVIELADWFAAFSKRRARLWLDRSEWWADFAEAIETGQSIEDVRRAQREDQQ